MWSHTSSAIAAVGCCEDWIHHDTFPRTGARQLGLYFRRENVDCWIIMIRVMMIIFLYIEWSENSDGVTTESFRFGAKDAGLNLFDPAFGRCRCG